MEVVVKNITDAKHAEEIKFLINQFYDELLGPDWTKLIPIKRIRESLYTAGQYTRDDMQEIYRGKDMNIALGIYFEDDLLGFLSIKLVSPSLGGVYHIYIKPEYRKSFISFFKANHDAVQTLNCSIESYFKNMNAKEIILEAPHSLEYLNDFAETFDYNFEKQYDFSNLYSKMIK